MLRNVTYTRHFCHENSFVQLRMSRITLDVTYCTGCDYSNAMRHICRKEFSWQKSLVMHCMWRIALDVTYWIRCDALWLSNICVDMTQPQCFISNRMRHIQCNKSHPQLGERILIAKIPCADVTYCTCHVTRARHVTRTCTCTCICDVRMRSLIKFTSAWARRVD